MKVRLCLVSFVVICLGLFPMMGYTEASKVVAEAIVSSGYPGDGNEKVALTNEKALLDSPWLLAESDLDMTSGSTVVSPVQIFYPNTDLIS